MRTGYFESFKKVHGCGFPLLDSWFISLDPPQCERWPSNAAKLMLNEDSTVFNITFLKFSIQKPQSSQSLVEPLPSSPSRRRPHNLSLTLY